MKRANKFTGRVDVQVSVLVAIVVLISSVSIFYLCYYITYADMIRSMVDRTNSIYSYVEQNLDKQTFYGLDTIEDINSPSYKENKAMLEQIKTVCNVRYLYTAKKNEAGELIYILDGLDYDALDFRYPGDLIEPEITEVLNRALAGEVIVPDKIKDTDWGKIFITYLPIHDQDSIIGVLGLEFEAERHFYTYEYLRKLTPVFCIIVCIISVFIAYLAFRRVSNPFYKDLYNTDRSTGLKNRNAFEVDIQNINGKKKYYDMGIIAMDLNALKKVNDMLGHDVGDQYISITADALKTYNQENMVFYRTGGDEFVVFVNNVAEEKIPAFIKQVQTYVENKSEMVGLPLGISAGYAIYDKVKDKDFMSTYKRADEAMYQEKRAYYQ